jgi:hypothetical protein
MTRAGAVMWRWRSNPLRRTSDTVEAWTRLLLGVLPRRTCTRDGNHDLGRSRNRVISAPLDHGAVVARSAGAGVAAFAGVIVAGLGVRLVVGRIGFRRRLIEWDRAWADVEPQWTHRA